MEIGKKKFAVIIIAAFLAGAAVTGGACAAVFNGLFGYVTVSESDYEQLVSAYDRFGKLNEIYDAAEESYYKEIDEEAVMDSVYKLSLIHI